MGKTYMLYIYVAEYWIKQRNCCNAYGFTYTYRTCKYGPRAVHVSLNVRIANAELAGLNKYVHYASVACVLSLWGNM